MKNGSFDSVPLLRLVIFLILGIIIGEHELLAVSWLPIFVGMVLVSLMLWRSALWQSVAVMATFMVLGALLAQRQKENLKVIWPGEEVNYEAVVLSEPAEKPKTMAVDVMMTECGRKLRCYIYKDERSRGLKVGDGLQIQSRIKSDGYRELAGSTFVPGWKWQKAQVSLAALPRLERTKIFFLKLRSRLLARLKSEGIDGKVYGVVAAMTLGDKSALTKDLKETYAVTGASHVLALSGLHLSIIYSLLSTLLMGRRWQTLSQLLLIVGIWAYVFLVGMSVSVVRSALMLSVYVLMSLGHREKMSLNTLAFTAMVLLIVNPSALYDVGFQMSFMAVLSILVLMPLMMSVFSMEYLMEHQVLKWLWSLLSVSCAAQIGVAPLIAYYFGRFSTYFLMTNVIVIPAVTLILYLSLAVFLIPPLAHLLLYIVDMLNTVLATIAALPGASIDSLHPTVLQVVTIYVIVALFYLLIIKIRRIASPGRGWSASTRGW